MKKHDLSVVLPSYNTRNLATNVSEIKKEVEKITKNYEIIVVNDGSTKEWEKELEKLKKQKNSKVKILSYNINKGKGYALKKGGIMAKGDKIIFLDSDLDIPPKQIKFFLDELNDTDIVIGSKRHPDSKIIYPASRKFMSAIYQRINSILFDLNVKDTQVGIKAFHSLVLKKNLPKLAIKRYVFDLELLVVANKEGYKIKEVPVEIEYKFGSTINMKSVLNMLWETAAIFYRLKILKHYDKN
jgi:glycosyltransferase involved in cell wall biosynthesis